ncbi:MAG TPA: tetratricopeptide repeat protein [Gemmatimonadales bacterium]|nr:tetratricopeptide repeat protein [Gemmatimonadales bacterium]
MATSVGAAQGTSPHAGESKLLAWVLQHRKAVTWGALVLLLAAGAFAWNFVSTRQSERVASQQLSSARFAFESKNYALAASELSRIAENYSGSRSADEASILLAQTRLAQGQSQQAIDVLKQFAPKASADYRAQAYGLLGASYENVGHPKEAAEAYEQASKNGRLPFERAQFLSDAGRAWLAARDTGRAVAAYQEIVSKLDSTGSAFEAKVRLGELQAGANK